MSRYRIVKKSKTYYVDKKVLFLWIREKTWSGIINDGLDPRPFNSFDDAKKWIDELKTLKSKRESFKKSKEEIMEII